MSEETVTVNVRLVGFSPRAILVAVEGREPGVWLPTKWARYEGIVRIGGAVDVTMPRWLARDRGLA